MEIQEAINYVESGEFIRLVQKLGNAEQRNDEMQEEYAKTTLCERKCNMTKECACRTIKQRTKVFQQYELKQLREQVAVVVGNLWHEPKNFFALVQCFPVHDRDIRALIRDTRKRKKYRYELSDEFVFNLFKKQGYRCAVTGQPFSMARPPGKKETRAPFKPSLDRIDPSGHYTEDNVRLVLASVNLAQAPDMFWRIIGNSYYLREEESVQYHGHRDMKHLLPIIPELRELTSSR